VITANLNSGEDRGWNLQSEIVYDGLGRLRKRLEYIWSAPSIAQQLDGLVDPNWALQSETDYIYDGLRVIQERDANTGPHVSYTRGRDLSGSLEGAGGIGGLLARSSGYSRGNFTTNAFYHADAGGNITFLLSSTEGLAARYRYDPFGNQVFAVGSLASANVYRFSSKEIHVNSGMYYYLYRFYDPNLQRWITRDPISEQGGLNLFSFLGNLVLRTIDPFGLARTPGFNPYNDDLWSTLCSTYRWSWPPDDFFPHPPSTKPIEDFGGRLGQGLFDLGKPILSEYGNNILGTIGFDTDSPFQSPPPLLVGAGLLLSGVAAGVWTEGPTLAIPIYRSRRFDVDAVLGRHLGGVSVTFRF
jgi:RHS repeat-associated protein